MNRLAPRRAAVVAAAVAIATAGGAGGCRRDFDPQTRLLSLRVLGMRSEPARPAPGDTATFSTVVYAPPGTPARLTYDWSWCPFPGASTNGYPCLVDDAQLAAVAGGAAAGIPPLDLGPGETATFPFAFDPSLLVAICAGGGGLPAKVDCTNGFPIQVRVTVSDEIGHSAVAVETFNLRHDPTTIPPNANPLVTSLSATVAGALVPLPDPTSPDILAVLPTAPMVPRGEDTLLTAGVDISQAEPTVDDQGNPTLERLTLSWYTESGNLDNRRTGFIDDGVSPFSDLLINKWDPASVASDEAPGASGYARIIVVLRDSRGGASWLQGIARLGAVGQ